MKANELMIGDWVKIKGDYGKPLKITTIDETYNSINYFDGDAEGELTLQLNEIEPIPLTTEILEKNGWIRGKYAYGRDCMEIYGAGELPEGVDNALSMAMWSIDKNYQYHFLDLYMWKGSVMQHNVHYVHQLQHAFRIFGIEKEIEL